MRLLRLILLVSGLAALGAGAGFLLGLPFGRRTSFFGATVVGTLAVLESLRLAVRLGWFDPDRRRGGAIGGLVGMAVGVPLVVMGLAQPWLVVIGIMLVGLGVVVGAGPASAR